MSKEAKFTATMVFNGDKDMVVDLRAEFDTTEKEMMNLVLRTALEHRDTLQKLVDELKANQLEVKNQKKAEKLEAQIAKLKSKK